MSVVLPKTPFVRPSMLDGINNGEVPAELLEPTGFGNAQAIQPAARAFRAFAAVECAPRRIELRHVGGYRSLHGQWAIFGGSQARYEPCSFAEWNSTPSAHRKTFQPSNRARVAALGYKVPDSFYWRKKRTASGGWPATAAEPGTSNHGWACAIDIAEERDGDPEPESLSPLLLSLLINRGHLYGIGAELDSEPWHWRYYAGDAIPKAVLDYEASIQKPTTPPVVLPPVTPTPTPVPDSEEEEEIVFTQFVTYRGHVFACYSDGTKKWYHDPAQVELATGLRSLAGKKTDNITLAATPQNSAMMVVLGPVVGPLPADRDAWGR